MKLLKGIAASPGIAIGPAFVYHPTDLIITRRRAEDPHAEWASYLGAAAETLGELAALRRKVAAEAGEAEAAIFDAHQMIIRDPDLEAELRAEIDAGASAESAVQAVFTPEISKFAAMSDPLFRERAIDFADVELRLLQLLLGVRDESLAAISAPSIVLARDLKPSDTAQMNKSLVRGFCTAAGGPLSHTAILARNLGLPAVVGVGDDLLEIASGVPLILDGTQGEVVVEAEETQHVAYEQRAMSLSAARASAIAAALEPAVTRDGRRVEVVANIGLPGEEVHALRAGAEGIGLLRTEFLFTGRRTAPSEEEHYQAYRPILEAMAHRPVIARTFDIGGDKPVEFLAMPSEANPFLGWRALRIGLTRPDLLKTQIRALLRAGHGCNLKIMFPMVATAEEMQAARALCDRARAELAQEGQPFADAVQVGAMIEVPSAALIADHLAQHADFFSIGSNDLTQYTLAADRGNPAVASLFDGLHPAVLRLVDQTIRAARACGKWVGICGELAGEAMALPVLLGLGLDEFSMGAAAIPAAKALIRRLAAAETEVLARRALMQPSAGAVRQIVNAWMADHGLADAQHAWG